MLRCTAFFLGHVRTVRSLQKSRLAPCLACVLLFFYAPWCMKPLCNATLRGVFSWSRTHCTLPAKNPPRALPCLRLSLFLLSKLCARIVWVKGLSSLRGAGREALTGVGRAHVFGLNKAKLALRPTAVAVFGTMRASSTMNARKTAIAVKSMRGISLKKTSMRTWVGRIRKKERLRNRSFCFNLSATFAKRTYHFSQEKYHFHILKISRFSVEKHITQTLFCLTPKLSTRTPSNARSWGY